MIVLPRTVIEPSMMQDTRVFERYVAAVAAVGCVVITVAIWWDVSKFQPMWPLPALYLIEAAALSIIAAAAFIRGDSRIRTVTWAAVGVLTAFSILGLLSIGALYLPTVLLLAAVCVTADLRNKSNLGLHLGICIAAGLAQAAVMLILIRFL